MFVRRVCHSFSGPDLDTRFPFSWQVEHLTHDCSLRIFVSMKTSAISSILQPIQKETAIFCSQEQSSQSTSLYSILKPSHMALIAKVTAGPFCRKRFLHPHGPFPASTLQKCFPPSARSYCNRRHPTVSCQNGVLFKIIPTRNQPFTV